MKTRNVMMRFVHFNFIQSQVQTRPKLSYTVPKHTNTRRHSASGCNTNTKRKVWFKRDADKQTHTSTRRDAGRPRRTQRRSFSELTNHFTVHSVTGDSAPCWPQAALTPHVTSRGRRRAETAPPSGSIGINFPLPRFIKRKRQR